MLPRRIPFFYGWVIVACAVCSAFARQGAAVATLSVFIEPMTAEFGWSRSALSGAVSLGGVLAALVAPFVGPVIDRRGARVALTAGALVVGCAALALAGTASLGWFYVAFSVGRLTFASAFDIGISGAIANWFVRTRAKAMSFVTVGSTIGLAVMPLLAHTAIAAGGWRVGWVVVAVSVLTVGAFPSALLMRRRPEDVGLVPDGAPAPGPRRAGDTRAAASEPHYTRAEALRTPALWLLMAYSVVIFPVQAGISLHQAPHVIQQGLSAAVAASVVSAYSLCAALSGLGFGLLARHAPVRVGLALSAGLMSASAVAMIGISAAWHAFTAAALFGAGIGGVLTLLPVAWADYFGRRNFGAIRGVTLPVQVVAQAVGPILAGVLFDASGSYRASLLVFAALGACGVGLALAARPPPVSA